MMISKRVAAELENLKYENVALVMRRRTFCKTFSRVDQEDKGTR